MFFNLLDDAAQTNTNNGWFTWVILAVFVVLVVVYFMFSGRKRGQAQKEYTEMLEAIKPGNKVKTAGGAGTPVVARTAAPPAYFNNVTFK